MANIVNVTQEQWDELTSTLQLAAQRAELWSKEREGLAAMLTQAHEALKEAKDDACYGSGTPYSFFPLLFDRLYYA